MFCIYNNDLFFCNYSKLFIYLLLHLGYIYIYSVSYLFLEGQEDNVYWYVQTHCIDSNSYESNQHIGVQYYHTLCNSLALVGCEGNVQKCVLIFCIDYIDYLDSLQRHAQLSNNFHIFDIYYLEEVYFCI